MARIAKFGPFELDRNQFELRRNGEPVKIDRAPLELLIFLVERAGKLVTRNEAVDHVWGKDVFVEPDSSLYTAIRKIRKALDDDTGEPRFIQTISRKGYRFIAAVEEVQVHPAAVTEPDALAPPADATTLPVTRVAASRRTGPWPLRIAVILGALAIDAVLIRHFAVHSPPRKVMLVVLPLENLSGDPQQEYLADGITEEITTELGSLDPEHLGVVARTSAMHYKHSPKMMAQISGELGVSYLLEGSIRRSGQNVRISAQLIQAHDQTHLWARSYDRELSDVLNVQREIASLVARQVRLTLSHNVNERLATTARVNPDAYDAYLRGLQGWNQRTREGFLDAIASFRRATELDPNYAPAFAGLARVYSLAPIFADIPASEAGPASLAAANRALSLNARLAEAHSAIGFVNGHYLYDWRVAKRELQTGVEMGPNSPYTHFFYSNSYLSPFGRHDEAIAEMRKAMELDPLSRSIQSFAGKTFLWARRYQEAIAQYQRVNQFDANFPVNRERLACLYALLGKFEDAIAEETKARVLSGEKAEDVVAGMNRVRQAVVARGAVGYWSAELELSEGPQQPPEGYSLPYGRAMVYAHLGKTHEALADLERAYLDREAQITELAVEPNFDALRGDPCFIELERRIGLETVFPRDE
ncbi:MAG: winged helix-turn-helix domain-containing protein [Acidobacteriaceae bacterium]|nr:winged helix-turn-helix domain-containing protein [Acidobacteriaceae bacterium]MBV9781788.1 winged helix-turn-helix domain-containing protein [Acidobacteriaceae bacterium]